MQAIEECVVATMATVSGIALDQFGNPAATAIPAGQMFDQKALRENLEFVVQTRPGAYPGALISLVEQDTQQLSALNGPSSAYTRLQTAVEVVIYATSPSGGVVANDARYKAWEVGEAAFKALMVLVPHGLPAGTQMMQPLQFAHFMEINVDPTTHGLLIVFNAEYQIGVVQ